MNIVRTENRSFAGAENKHGVPGKAESYWISSSAGTDYPTLASEITVDVAIVGGGFVGIASAMELKEAGLKVAVIEARQIIQGVTGNTTAKVAYQIKMDGDQIKLVV